MALQKVAVVTGSNKGIGYAIVKGLCEKYEGIVYLTSRDVNRGKQAVEKLKDLGLSPQYHQLDITDQDSITKLKDYMVQTHGGIDLLVNNAGVSFRRRVVVTESFDEQAQITININYFGTLKVCETLFPILRKDARVVHLSSSCGHLSRIPSLELKKKFSDPLLTTGELNDLMRQYIKDAVDGKHDEAGWSSSYEVSKVGVSALTLIQQREIDKEKPCRNISVNSVHPGFVDTDMTNHAGPLTIEEGASAPLFLALEPHNLKGKYVWYDSTVVDWCADSTPTPW